MHQLTKLDADILAFIRKREFVTLDDVQKRFPKVETAERRIQLMSKTPDALICPERTYWQDEIGQLLHDDTGRYSLTPDGDKALEDYRYEHKTNQRELWLKSVWLPMLVALGTALLTMALTRWLSPLIQ